MRRFLARAAVVMLALQGLAAAPAGAQLERVSRGVLRVCADPNALPFSRADGTGFENRIAAMIAADLRVPLETVWYPATVGFVRNTLSARTCDLVLGTASGGTAMLNTNPYYRSAYALVARADSGLDIAALQAGRLRHRRVGVVERTPGAAIATALGIEDVATYDLLTQPDGLPPAQLAVQAVRDGVLDAAFIWGPVAGYFARGSDPLLSVLALPDGTAGQRTEFNIAMGLRAGEPEWKAWLNAWIAANHERIRATLSEFAIETIE